MKRTLGLGNGRAKHGNITVDGMRIWARKRRRKNKGKKRGQKLAPIFYVTYHRQDGKRVSKSTGQRRRNVAVAAAPLVISEKQPLLFPAPEPDQQELLAI